MNKEFIKALSIAIVLLVGYSTPALAKTRTRTTLKKQIAEIEEQLIQKEQELEATLAEVQQSQVQKINGEINKVNSLDTHIQATDKYLTSLQEGYNNSLSYNKIPYATKIAGYSLKLWGLKFAKFIGIGALELTKKPAITISTAFNNKIMVLRSQRDKLQSQLTAKQEELFGAQ